MYKVAIISCGMITNNAHIPAYKHLPEVYTIAAVCDINEDAAKGTASRHGIGKYYTDAEKMLDEIKPDIVSVCVPNSMHKKYTMMALEKGAHVLCEKPVAFTYADAMEMYSLAKEKGKHLIACQSMRFTPDRLALKKLIEEGKMGEIYYGEMSRVRRRGIPTWGTFHMKKISCGGAMVDIGVHMIDSLIWLMGNPKLHSVTATTGCRYSKEIGSLHASGALGDVHTARKFNPDEMDVEDFSCGSMVFENGARVNFKVAWAMNSPEETSIKLVGKQMGADIPSCCLYSGVDTDEKLDTKPNLYESEPFFGHFYITDNLAKVLEGKEELIIKPEETINVASILECFYKSAELGREVLMSEIV